MNLGFNFRWCGFAFALIFPAVWLQGAENSPAGDYPVSQPDQFVFYNADHSPFGAYASFVYGQEGCQASDNTKPVDLLIGTIPAGAASGANGAFMPFVDEQWGTRLGLIDKNVVSRKMGACTDSWSAGDLSWVHYTPAWYLREWDTASLDEQRRFVLPATWMEITCDNTRGSIDKILLTGLPLAAERTTLPGGEEGFIAGDLSLSVPPGTCECLQADALGKLLGTPIPHAFAFAMTVPAGQKKTLVVTICSYRPGPSFGSPNVYMYTQLFRGLDDIVDEAGRVFESAKARCTYLDGKLGGSGLNFYRQFVAGHALHSYLFNTALLATPEHRPLAIELEGEYHFLNTFDLTVDHVFYQAAMYPWITRNILDEFAAHYRYGSTLADTATHRSVGGAISFTHDMGRDTFAPPGTSAYERPGAYMSQEELQNWILCAGIYWKGTHDDVWLKQQLALLQGCLQSMLERDALEPAQRDGIPSLTDSRGEITTYDALDNALKSVPESTYLAVKSWAAYLALEAMFTELDSHAEAARAHDQAVLCSRSITAGFDAKEGYVPALLDGKNGSRIIPAVEGLIFPQRMGLGDAVSASGPYGPMVRTLRAHLDHVLKPGVCLDTTSGAWKLSSTSTNTWQSKVYLAQYIAENILGIKDERTGGRVDAVQATFEAHADPQACWTDQLDSRNGSWLGSAHYPRGVTSSLWWLSSGK